MIRLLQAGNVIKRFNAHKIGADPWPGFGVYSNFYNNDITINIMIIETSEKSILNVQRDANRGEIKNAFIHLARLHHPDNNPGSESAQAKFLEIQNAYREGRFLKW